MGAKVTTVLFLVEGEEENSHFVEYIIISKEFLVHFHI